jgi:hypothetical protein
VAWGGGWGRPARAGGGGGRSALGRRGPSGERDVVVGSIASIHVVVQLALNVHQEGTCAQAEEVGLGPA